MNEKIILSIPAIVRNLKKVNDTPEMESKTENSMLITDKRIILLKVPTTPDDIARGSKITDNEWSLIKQKTEQKLNDIISSEPLETILKTIPNFSINLQDIKKVEIHMFSMEINIKTNLGQEYSYTIWDNKIMEELKQVLKKYI